MEAPPEYQRNDTGADVEVAVPIDNDTKAQQKLVIPTCSTTSTSDKCSTVTLSESSVMEAEERTAETDLPTSDRSTEVEALEPPATESGAESVLNARRRHRNKKIFIALCMLCFIIYLIVDAVTMGNVRSALKSFLKWIEANPILGIFVFMFGYLLSVVLVIPGSILTLGAGFVFAKAFGLALGVVLASLSVFLGASLGAMLSFLLGRYLLRDWVQGLATKYSIFEALEIALKEKGFRIMALLRLLPIIPFIVLNYIAGVTSISFWDNTLALFFTLPGTVIYVFLGASAGSLAASAGSGGLTPLTIALIVGGVIFGIFAILFITFYARKELNRVMAAQQADQDDVELVDSAPVEMNDDVNQMEESYSISGEDAV